MRLRGLSRMWVGIVTMVVGATVAARAADPFIKPTPEELAMTSLPGYPGAAAMVLFREEITRDDLHVVQHYERIKILTEAGEKYANIQLNFVSTSSYGELGGDDKTVRDIVARTIHPDGTIIAFTGKPYKKVMEQTGGEKVEAMIFTLPDVQVGSIIEYRYETEISDNSYEAPDWYIQGNLYLKAAHFVWYPTTRRLVDTRSGAEINSISWFPILPPGVKVVRQILPGGTLGPAAQTYEVRVKDVPPTVKEDYMPPIASFSYRVLFNFSPFRSSDEFWKSEGKEWAKRDDSFANPDSNLRAATQAIVAGATTEDDKLRRIYAAVMALENTKFTREHEQREDKAEGEGKLKTAADVLTHKRGDSTQLTELFVGMARAAGMKAYLMLVPDRSRDLFTAYWLSFRQFDSVIAIVNVDGKDVYFDPGSRYCAYGHLAWQHTSVQGLREVDGGTEFTTTAGDSYKANSTTRVANLTLDGQGEVTGKIDLTFDGAAALRWRQTALRGDDESLKHELQRMLEGMLPKSLQVKVSQVQNLDDYEKPLLVSYQVNGALGTSTGKRLVLPAELFEAGSSASFPDEKRQNAVYFKYPQVVRDALRINLPQSFAVEAVPTDGKFSIPRRALYDMTVVPTHTNFTTRRDYVQGWFLYLSAEYPTLRTFYSQLESKDQESVVLKAAEAQQATGSSPAND